MKTKKLVGQVSEGERNEIRTLFERKNGLLELAKIIGNDDSLYEKMVKDLGATSSRFEQWWNRMGEKYQWESDDKSQWEIDFDTCEIYLTK